MRHFNQIWTKELVIDAARKYATVGDFRTHDAKAYRAAIRWGWFDEVTKHMTSLRKFNGYWTKSRCHNKSLRCKTRNEFNRLYKSAYLASYRNGWLDEICSHMELKHVQKPSSYYTYDLLREIALKYKTRSSFQREDNAAYQQASKKGYLDEICSHMKAQGSRKRRCLYKITNGSDVYIGITYNIEIRQKQHRESKRISKIFGKDLLLEQISDFMILEDALRLEKDAIDAYRNNGVSIINIKGGGSPGGSVITWTKESVREEALKYQSRKEFERSNRQAYAAAHRHGWTNELFQHMDRLRKPNGYWDNLDRCLKERLKYESLSEFAMKSGSAYNAARRNGWLDHIRRVGESC